MAQEKALNPTRKVSVGALAGAISAITVWALDEFVGVKLPAEIAVACTVVITFIVQWIVPDAQEAP
jgi:putative flippase GtrA